MKTIAAEDQAAFAELVEVRSQTIELARQTIELSRKRRALIERLLAKGYAQADVARELGVTRQAVQK